jgi:hypothetical protein
MFGLVALLSLISQVSGTPYIPGGDSPAGTDCSGLASWVANVAAGRPAFGSRFNTGNMEPALLARGFHYGSAPNSVVIGWNSGHAAVTLPDGTPVSSGEGNHGVRVGGGGAYQPQFNHHMYLPVQAQEMTVTPPAQAAPPAEVGTVELAAAGAPAPDAAPADAPVAAEVPVPADSPLSGPALAEAPVAAEAQAPIAAPAGDVPPADPAPLPSA